MKTKGLVLLMMLLLPLALAAQAVIEGRVSDAESGEPLAFVNIGVKDSPAGTSSSVDGSYKLVAPLADSITLVFSHTGYAIVQQTVHDLKKNAKVSLDITLVPAARQLNEVSVRESRSRGEAFATLGIEKIRAVAGPAMGVEGLLKTLPDVVSNNELSNQYSVRGGSFDENLVYINGVEVFRPMLIRNGQQEGTSLINPDLVSSVRFSPGGFEAQYGDRLSSVLDIDYRIADGFGGRVGMSLLGGQVAVHGSIDSSWSAAIALRRNSNNYIFGSLDTRGIYTTAYTDLQALLQYRATQRHTLNLLAIVTNNNYGLVPESQTTTFGGYVLPMQLNIYFDGQEQDKYRTWLLAVASDYAIADGWRLKSHASWQRITETERYDVQSQYWLSEVGLGEEEGDTVHFNKGVGTFLEHASNRMLTSIYAIESRLKGDVRLGEWNIGLRLQADNIEDHIREWRWVDSSGYSLPSTPYIYGDSSNSPLPPQLQQFSRSNNTLNTLHAMMFAMREVNFTTHKNSEIKMVAGLRAHIYSSVMTDWSEENGTGWRLMLSPRVSMGYNPRWQKDIVFRLSAGVYSQAPFYREYRRNDGTLCANLEYQTSEQLNATADWNTRWGNVPMRITADVYGKYLPRLVPYTIDNLRVRYMPDKNACGYSYGLSVRVNGELVEGLESWASVSLMHTQEDIEGDGLGWIDRPTDQRIAVKLFVQDYVPTIPWWSMSLVMVAADGMPIKTPFMTQSDNSFRLPAYFRIDWGNALHFSKLKQFANSKVFKYVKDVQLGVDVFNLFNYRNVASYLWVSDIENIYYPVPNYLTSRQLNVKLTLIF